MFVQFVGYNGGVEKSKGKIRISPQLGKTLELWRRASVLVVRLLFPFTSIFHPIRPSYDSTVYARIHAALSQKLTKNMHLLVFGHGKQIEWRVRRDNDISVLKENQLSRESGNAWRNTSAENRPARGETDKPTSLILVLGPKGKNALTVGRIDVYTYVRLTSWTHNSAVLFFETKVDHELTKSLRPL